MGVNLRGRVGEILYIGPHSISLDQPTPLIDSQTLVTLHAGRRPFLGHRAREPVPGLPGRGRGAGCGGKWKRGAMDYRVCMCGWPGI